VELVRVDVLLRKCGAERGRGIYEGSYYTFSYIFGTPVVGTPSDPAGTGSLYAPKYSNQPIWESHTARQGTTGT